MLADVIQDRIVRSSKSFLIEEEILMRERRCIK